LEEILALIALLCDVLDSSSEDESVSEVAPSSDQQATSTAAELLTPDVDGVAVSTAVTVEMSPPASDQQNVSAVADASAFYENVSVPLSDADDVVQQQQREEEQSQEQRGEWQQQREQQRENAEVIEQRQPTHSDVDVLPTSRPQCMCDCCTFF